MISDRILTRRCDIQELSGYIYDDVGCPISAVYNDILENVPCYYTEINYQTLPGKEPIKDIFRMFINVNSSINTNYKIFIDDTSFDILNVQNVFDDKHVELIIKKISI